MRTKVAVVLLAVFAFLAGACDKKKIQCPTCPDGSGSFSVTLTPNPLNLQVGHTGQLQVVVTGSQQYQVIGWASSNTSIATVANGQVTAVAVGETTVMVSIVCNGTTKTATAVVKVTSGPGQPPVPVRIVLTPETMSLAVLGTQTATAVVTGPAGVNTDVIWQSQDAGIATVTNQVATATGETAVVTGMKAGTVRIIGTAVADPNARDTILVTVTGNTGGSGYITSIFINPTQVYLNVGSEFTFTVTVNGDANADKTFTCAPTSSAAGMIQVVAVTATTCRVRALQVYVPGQTARPTVVVRTNGRTVPMAGSANGFQLEAGAFVDTRPAGTP